MSDKPTISKKLILCALNIFSNINAAAAQKIRNFIESQITDEGLFCNRAGKPDLYYTYFGILSAVILGNIKIPIKKINRYLQIVKPEHLDFIHLTAYIRIRQLLKLYLLTNKFRLPLKNLITSLPSMFSKNQKAAILLNEFYHSTQNNNLFPLQDKQCPYSIFLYVCALQDCGEKSADEYLINNLKNYRKKNGGYTNLKNSQNPILNATVAAALILHQFSNTISDDSIEFIKKQQPTDGGFNAVQGAPVPDLLSTAVALFTLNYFDEKELYSARDFIYDVWQDDGGFSGTTLDNKSDTEYTFYGLLALGALK